MSLGEIALVTGSSSGIGRAIAIRLARDGFHVGVHFNNNKKGAEETLAEIHRNSGSGELLHFDVKDSKSIIEALDVFTKKFGEKHISVLVNNAGITDDGLTGLMSDDSFDKVIKTNLYGPFYLMRWCVKKMMIKRSGIIINISSLAGQAGHAGQMNYAASKAALIAMTKSLAQEVGARGIRVNAVAPGLIETEMLNGVPGLDDLKKMIPLGRIGSSDDVAGSVSFLCSKDAQYITGHTISVNGGLFTS